MVTRVDGNLIAEVTSEWGVRWEGMTGDVIWCETEAEARNLSDDTGGELVVRTVYVTDWRKVS